MTRALLAFLISLAFHAALFFVFVVFAVRPSPALDRVAMIELSNIEFSTAEEECEEAESAVVESAPEPPPPPPSEEPVREEPPVPEPLVEDAPAVSPMEEPQPAPPPPVSAAEVPRPAPNEAKIEAPPRPKTDIRPEYPRQARQRGEEGDVILEIAVSASGSVEEALVAVSSGFPELDAAAAKAVRKARFVPASADGVDIASRARLTVTFQLK